MDTTNFHIVFSRYIVHPYSPILFETNFTGLLITKSKHSLTHSFFSHYRLYLYLYLYIYTHTPLFPRSEDMSHVMCVVRTLLLYRNLYC